MKPTISLLVREIHPIREGKRKWRYKPICTIELPLYEDHPPCKMYANGVLMAEIVGRKLLIHATYVWNGCSPKYYVGWPPFGMWVGTPDFDGTILASLGHDVLFQFSALLRYEMYVVNNQFLFWMDDDGFEPDLRDIYHGAVEKWGAKYWGKADPSLSVDYTDHNHDSHDDHTYAL
jgi:hypothetical protein